MPKHISVPVEHTVELLNLTPVNPLISKCQIKVCYVGDKPNRNRSVITKAVATQMANSLPGCPIVGFFNEHTGDFEEHNRQIDVSNGKFKIIDMTKAYGFVDLNAKVWFQKFLDDGVEHEYLVTEGYIWTSVYEESKRIVERGNNQSMELHEETLKGQWTMTDKGCPEFFIINEGLIEKLCVLGEEVEPCFEGAAIATNFSLSDDFKQSLLEFKRVLQEGGEPEMNEEKTILTEEEKNTEEVIEPTVDEYKKKDEDEEKKKKPFPPEKEDNSDEDDKKDSEEDKKGEEEEDEDKKKKKAKFAQEEEKEEKVCPECGKPVSECECEKKPAKHSIEDHEEYVQLKHAYEQLQADYALLQNEIEPLRTFKLEAEKKEKEAMIASFYMLSDEDKADVVANISTYSLEEIEAKLSVICVRNKVNFSLDDDKESAPTTYNLNTADDGDTAPAWVKAVRNTAKNMI